MFYSIEQDLHRLKYRQPKRGNLTKGEYQSIKSLRNHTDLIIKPADKGSAIVIQKKNTMSKKEKDNFTMIIFMKKLKLTSLERSYTE